MYISLLKPILENDFPKLSRINKALDTIPMIGSYLSLIFIPIILVLGHLSAIFFNLSLNNNNNNNPLSIIVLFFLFIASYFFAYLINKKTINKKHLHMKKYDYLLEIEQYESKNQYLQALEKQFEFITYLINVFYFNGNIPSNLDEEFINSISDETENKQLLIKIIKIKNKRELLLKNSMRIGEKEYLKFQREFISIRKLIEKK
jgi:hypothetical protein